MKKITFTTALVASACAFGGFEGHVSSDGYVPGLQQGVFRDGGLADISFYATCAEADRFSHTLGTILADVNATRTCQARNELSGKLETWPQWGAVLYEGEMYFEGGQEYNFFGCVDDLVACELDGAFFWCEGYQQISKRGIVVYSKTYKESGWHPIRVWLADAGGGRGTWSRRIGFQGVGIGWNTNGCKVVDATTQMQWNRLLDDGSGRLLRSKVLPQKNAKQDESGPVGANDGEVRTFGAHDGLPIEIEMVWVAGRGEVDGFWMSKNRITQLQYKIIVGCNPVDPDKQDDEAPINYGLNTVEFVWNLNARYTGAGRFARMSDARWKLAAKYCSVGLPLEAECLRVVFKPVDRRNVEREAQKLVKSGSDVAFEAMLAKGEAKRYSLADGLDLDIIKVEGCGDTFYLGRYEVTQEQYEKVMSSNPSDYGGADNMPVSSVNWANATEFCQKLNALLPIEGMTWTLPSAKQWSFAANGGLKKKGNSFFGGDDWHEVGWWGANEYGNWWTHPVGLKKPNELGFHDLFGNVWEWCCDDDGRKDCKYISGVGTGAWYLMEFFVCVNANQIYGDYGFRVALVPTISCDVANESNASSSCRIEINAQQQKVIDRHAQAELDRAQREAERAEQRAQLLAIQDELKRVRGAKAAEDAAVKDSSPEVQKAVKSILKGMIKVPGRDYWLSATELTQEQWEPIMGYNLSEHKGANLPVECVSRDDCDVFLEKLNQEKEVLELGFEFCLPKADEWLYAAQAGCGMADVCWIKAGVAGNVLEMAWVKENSSNQTHEVATKAANAFGFYDMKGNVWEWLFDSERERGVRRGHAFVEDVEKCSLHNWRNTPRNLRYGDCGLRLAAHKRVGDSCPGECEELGGNEGVTGNSAGR